MKEYRIIENKSGDTSEFYVESKKDTFFGRLFGWRRHQDLFTNYLFFDSKVKAEEWVKKCKGWDGTKTIIHEA